MGAVEAFSPQQLMITWEVTMKRQSAVAKVPYQASDFQALCLENTKSEFPRHLKSERNFPGDVQPLTAGGGPKPGWLSGNTV